jgi:pyrimidine and pyridine-specific 5'-nucleotidase
MLHLQLSTVCSGLYCPGAIIAKLSGHNKGLKAVAINSRYVVSAGMDKALVVWDWRDGGKKLVRFGQQTNVNIGIALVDSKLVSIQVDGTVRTFE